MLALPVANSRSGNHILEVFLRRFLIEEKNSYEDLLEVMKNRYPAKCKKVFSVVMVSTRKAQLRMELSISGQCKMRTADCRLQTVDWGNMQTEGKNADCRLVINNGNNTVDIYLKRL